jgi:endonuclease YncB( thermonuclease family)
MAGTEWAWPASVISRVIDGDTVDAMLTRDLGFQASATFPVRLRLNRINADPAHTDTGMRCKARVLALTAGARLSITTGKSYKYGAPDGKTGEWMAEVLLPDGRNLSDVLVTEGLAVHWDGEGPRPDQP